MVKTNSLKFKLFALALALISTYSNFSNNNLESSDKLNPNNNLELSSKLSPEIINLIKDAKVNNIFVPIHFVSKDEIIKFGQKEKEEQTYKPIITNINPFQIIIDIDWFMTLNDRIKKLVIEEAFLSLKFFSQPHVTITQNINLGCNLGLIVASFASSFLLHKKFTHDKDLKTQILAYLALNLGFKLTQISVLKLAAKIGNHFSKTELTKKYWTYFIEETDYSKEDVIELLTIQADAAKEFKKELEIIKRHFELD